MAQIQDIQYISDEDGNLTGVMVPIELWREFCAEQETAYLLSSDTMKRRLMEAKDNQEAAISFERVREQLGV